MSRRPPLSLYLRSPLNIAVAAGCGAVATAGAVLLPMGPAGAVVAGAALVYLVISATLFFSRRGARVMVRQAEAGEQATHLQKITESAALRDRLAVLRIQDPEVRKAVELVHLAAGQYLERARERGLSSPLAGDQIRVALEICQAYLAELDESATERRYGVTDGDEGVDNRGRAIETLKGCASAIRRHALADLGGLDGTESITVIRETEGGT